MIYRLAKSLGPHAVRTVWKRDSTPLRPVQNYSTGYLQIELLCFDSRLVDLQQAAVNE